MSYLLDTDVCIALIRNRPASARARLADVAERGMDLFVSSISLFELWYGCVRSEHPERNVERLAIFMAHPTVLNFTEDDAAVAGRIPGEIEMKGPDRRLRPVGGRAGAAGGPHPRHRR